jgi:demethoxyubiquinone hydroxylase (CLK1/Coq7/Cat5 family)
MGPGYLDGDLGATRHLDMHCRNREHFNAHLVQQVEFLRTGDREVLAAVESIQSDEASHEEYARTQGGDNPAGFYLLLWRSITGATECAIWLSTRM